MTILSTNVTGIFQWSPEIAISESTRFEDLFALNTTYKLQYI